MFGGGAIEELPRGSGTGGSDDHFIGITPVHVGVAYSSSSLTAKPVRTLAEASTSGTDTTIVPFNSCSVGGRTVDQRPRITYSTKSRMAASFAASPSTGSAWPITTTER